MIEYALRFCTKQGWNLYKKYANKLIFNCLKPGVLQINFL